MKLFFIDSLIPFKQKTKPLQKLNVLEFLIRRYGLNIQTVLLLCTYIGINPYLLLVNVPINYLLDNLRKFFIDNIIHLDKNLKEQSIKNYNILIKINSYRGFRHFNGYPSRGQRTRCNGKIKKKFSSTYNRLKVRSKN